MKKPAIPSLSKLADPSQAKFNAAVKERLELLSGERGTKLAILPAGATLDEVIAKINELIGQMQ